MSDHSESPARPVSLFTIAFLFVLFAAFLFFVRKAYTPAATLPQNAVAENASKDNAWRATSTARQATLTELREQQAKQASSYGWVGDQKSGVVRLPIDRAMDLTVQHYSAKK